MQPYFQTKSFSSPTFGSPIFSRAFACGEYRYGMNSHEKVDEVKGSGNHYTATHWEYDPRLGRRWNQDPKPNPSISNYAAFANNPIWYSDHEGDTIKVEGSAGFKLRTKTVLFLASVFSKDAREKIKDLKASTNVHTIKKETSGGNYSQSNSYGVDDSPLGYVTTTTGGVGTGKGTGSTIGWDITSKDGGENVKGETKRPKYIGLLHEVFHSWQMDRGEIKRNPVGGVKQSEREAVHFENQMRSQLGRIPLRKKYGGVDVLRTDFDYKKNKVIPPPAPSP
jgi:hypothetical protein